MFQGKQQKSEQNLSEVLYVMLVQIQHMTVYSVENEPAGIGRQASGV
jgi:hypothetical protein